MKTKNTLYATALALALTTGLSACSGENNPLASATGSTASLVSDEGVMEAQIGKATAHIIGKLSKGDTADLESFWKMKETMPPEIDDKEAMLKKANEVLAYSLKGMSDSMQRDKVKEVQLDSQEKKGHRIVQNFHLTTADGKQNQGMMTWKEFGKSGYVVHDVRFNR